MFGVHAWREIANAFTAVSFITSRVYAETGHSNEEAQSEGEVLMQNRGLGVATPWTPVRAEMTLLMLIYLMATFKIVVIIIVK